MYDLSPENDGTVESDAQCRIEAAECILQQSPDPIFVTDPRGCVTYLNPAAARAFGYSREQAEGQALESLIRLPPASCSTIRLVGGGSVVTVRDSPGDVRETEVRLRRLVEADVVGIIIAGPDGIVEANDHFLRMLGYSREELRAGALSWSAITPPEHMQSTLQALRSLRESGKSQSYFKEYLCRSGARVPVLAGGVTTEAASGDDPQFRFIGFTIDLTERKSLENQMRQAQKMESIGRLAGGVAHDFNNLLTIIHGYARMLSDEVSPDHPFREALDEISAAAARAATLTRQLLTFSGRHITAPKVMCLNDLVRETGKMLRRVLSAAIAITISTDAEPAFIHADPSLVEQVILNLAVNAMDAMPGGGELYVETARMVVADQMAEMCLAAPPGVYVALSVSDTGSGMTPEVQSRIFDPFFTTKEQGKGTGLGLSTVYGVVRDSGSFISVHSAPGMGTAFRILFPAAAAPVAAEEPARAARTMTGTETILLVEDETGVRRFIRSILDRNGYSVLDAANGPDAIELATRHKGSIHLLVTDLALPGMDGVEIIGRVSALRPGIPVLRMSGYSERIGRQGTEGLPYIQKPFTSRALLEEVRRILDGTQ